MKFYGIAELAEAVGASPATVSQWFKRGKLPKPDAVLKMGPVWTGRTVAVWIKKTKGTR